MARRKGASPSDEPKAEPAESPPSLLVTRLGPAAGPLTAAAIVLVYALVLFARGHPWDVDQAYQRLPWLHVYRTARSFPLWTAGIWGGYPIHAEGQGGFLHFPTRWVSALPVSDVVAMELEIALALALAAASGALLARALGRSHAASAIAGVAWSLGCGLLVMQENVAVLDACAWLPLVLAAGALHARAPAPWWPILAGAALGLSLLAGWPYAFAFGVAVGLPWWALGIGAVTPASTWRARSLAFLAAVAIGFLLGAAQAWPTLELLSESHRVGGLGAGVSENDVKPGELLFVALPFLPHAIRHSPRQTVLAYAGISTLLLAVVTLARAVWLDRTCRFLAVLAVVAVLLALAPSLGLGPVLAKLPLVSLGRGPAKLMIVLGLAVAQLAAAGADVAASVLTRKGDPVRATAWAIAAVVVLDLAIHGQRRAEIVDRSLLDVRPKAADEVKAGERSLGTLDATDIDPEQLPADVAEAKKWLVENDLLEPDRNLLFQVRDLAGYTPLMPRRMREYVQAGKTRTELFARAGVSRIVAAPRPRLGDLGAKVETPGFIVYEVPAQPRVRLVWFATWSDDPLRALATTPVTRAVVDDPDLALDLEHNHPSPTHAFGIAPRIAVDDDAYVQVADVRCPEEQTAGALLVLADLWYPGWVAEVDDKPADVLRVDHALRAVRVPPGDHIVRFRYDPASYRAGKTASLVTAALAAIAIVAALIRARRASAPA